MNNAIMDIYERGAQWLWKDDLRTMSGPRRWLVVAMRMLVVLARQLLGGQLNLRAMSLVYTTLLSVVPLLAVSFSVLKGFGVHNQLEPVLLNFLAPLGAKGTEVANTMGYQKGTAVANAKGSQKGKEVVSSTGYQKGHKVAHMQGHKGGRSWQEMGWNGLRSSRTSDRV